MVSTDLPTPEAFEQAQEAIENGEYPEEAPRFVDSALANEFDDYTEFMSYVAAQKAASGSKDAFETRRSLDKYERAAKGLLLGIGAVALVEAVIGDARL